MKKTLLILIIFIAFFETLSAQNRRGAMQIRLRDNKLLTIIVDGIHFPKYGTTLTVSDLPQGMHDLKVYNFYPANDPNRNSSKESRPRAVLIYKGRIQINGGAMYYCTIDPTYKTLSFRESRTISLDEVNDNFRITTEPIFSDEQLKAKSGVYIVKDKKRENEETVLSYYRDEHKITSAQLSHLKDLLEDNMNAEEDLNEIKKYISDKSIMTVQVIKIMGWFSYESSKLDVAKVCFPKVLDKENYSEITNMLKFQSSKRSLNELVNDEKTKNEKNVELEEQVGNESRNKNGRNTQAATPQFVLADEIAALHKNIATKIIDSDKQILMVQFLEKRIFFTAQLSEMLDWLTFEGSKLEFSKWSFDKLKDPENFNQIKSKFRFNSSKKTIDDVQKSKE